MRSQFATASEKRNDRFLPWAFTEHGALMAANVLRGEQAARMGIYIVRAFVALRRAALEHEGMARRLAEAEQALLRHDAELDDLYWKLEPLLAPSEAPKPARRMGFTRE